MFFPEFLLALSERDIQATKLDPVVQRINSANAAVDVWSDFVVPNDRSLILQSAVCRAVAGGALTCTDIVIGLRPRASVSVSELVDLSYETADSPLLFTKWAGSILVPPMWIVTGYGAFSAATSSNTIRLSICGMLIPPANVQRI